MRCGGEAYIAEAPPILAGYGGLYMVLFNAAAEPLVVFYSTAQTNGRAVTLRD